MRSLRMPFSTVIKCTIFLACLSASHGKGSISWSGPATDEIITIDTDRPDGGVSYVVYSANCTDEAYDLHLEVPGSNPLKFSLYPKAEWDIMGFEPLGDRSVLVTYFNNITSNVEFMITNLKEAKTREVDTSDILLEDFGDLIFYDDHFDIIVRNKTVCGKSDVCRIPFNEYGKRINKIVPFNPFVNGTDPIGEPFIPATSSRSSIKRAGFYHELYNETSDQLLYSYVDDEGVHLKSFEAQEGYYSAISTAAGLFATCAMDYVSNFTKKEARCLQFNPSTLTTIKNKTFSVHKNAVSLAVINVAQKELIVSTAVVRDVKNHKLVDEFDVIHVRSDGGEYHHGPYKLDLRCGDCDGRQLYGGITEADQQFCFTFSCEYNSGTNHNYTFVSKCLQKSQFVPPQNLRHS